MDKLLEAQETADLHYAILWNLDQLVSSITNIMNSFKFGELAITLLNKGILNAELIELQSFERIIVEGRKSFPQLDFPLSIGRYELPHIVKILKVQRIAHLKFLMVIPLTSKQEYEVFSIIPHPVKLGPNALVLPDLRNIILVDNNTYIITDNINVYSISLQHHLLLEVEPIYNKMKSTCEWEAFKLNNTAMIELCSYHKIGQLNDTVVIETDQHRLVYFSEPTKVSLDCPEKQVRDTLSGLHQLPLACNIKTDYVFWPAKQTVTIAMDLNDTHAVGLDSTYLPIIDVNKTSKIHISLRDLITKLPKEDDPFTIDFEYYELTLEKIQTYSIYAQSFLTIIVVVNSFLIGFLFVKWLLNRRRNIESSHNSSIRNKFKGLRSSLRSRKHNFDKRDSLSNVKNRLQAKSRNIRDSLRSKGSSITRRIKSKVPPSPNVTQKLEHLEPFRPTASLNALTSSNSNAGTNTDLNWQLPPYAPEIYPALPRYN